MVQITLNLDDKLVEESTKILNELGLDLSEAINIFLAQVVLHDGIPFDVTLKKSDSYKD